MHIFTIGDGKGLTLTELRQLALDLRKQDEQYQQLYSQMVQQIADRFHRLGSAFLRGITFPQGEEAAQVLQFSVSAEWLENIENKGDKD
nr:hypothetical protein [Caldivirga sp.]